MENGCRNGGYNLITTECGSFHFNMDITSIGNEIHYQGKWNYQGDLAVPGCLRMVTLLTLVGLKPDFRLPTKVTNNAVATEGRAYHVGRMTSKRTSSKQLTPILNGEVLKRRPVAVSHTQVRLPKCVHLDASPKWVCPKIWYPLDPPV